VCTLFADTNPERQGVVPNMRLKLPWCASTRMAARSRLECTSLGEALQHLSPTK
jgi:hypothetical protein